MRFWAIQNSKNEKFATISKAGNKAPRLFSSRNLASWEMQRLINAEKALAQFEGRRAIAVSAFKIVRVKLEIIEDAWSKKYE